MLHARIFAESDHYRKQSLRAAPPPDNKEPVLSYDGEQKSDRPLIIQFCANDPQYLLSAAKIAQHHCDAIDLNLGCPQGIARKGHYGAFLQEQPDLIYKLINTLHEELDVPVTAKIRILESKEKTLDYAKMVVRAGASILTVHGRRREQKSHNTGLADWTYIRYLRDNLPPETVIFANGNILYNTDVEACLEATGADGVMSAEGNLYNPAVFASPSATYEERFPRVDVVVRQYLDIIKAVSFGVDAEVRSISKEETREHASLMYIKSHLFKLLHAVFNIKDNHYIRNILAKAHGSEFSDFIKIADELEKVVEAQLKLTPETPEQWEEILKDSGGVGADAKILAIPWWRCQPYVRQTPQEAYKNGAMQLSKKQLKAEEAKRGREVEPDKSTADPKEEQDDTPAKRQKLDVDSKTIEKNDQLAVLDPKIAG